MAATAHPAGRNRRADAGSTVAGRGAVATATTDQLRTAVAAGREAFGARASTTTAPRSAALARLSRLTAPPSSCSALWRGSTARMTASLTEAITVASAVAPTGG